MSNALYAKGRQSFLDGEISWSDDDIKALLVTSGYTADLTNDEFLSDIDAGDRVGASDAFANKDSTSGVANSDNVVYGLLSGDAVAAIVLYQSTGVEGTSRLIAYLDTAVNMPFTPGGGNVEIQWSDGATKIFKL